MLLLSAILNTRALFNSWAQAFVQRTYRTVVHHIILTTRHAPAASSRRCLCYVRQMSMIIANLDWKRESRLGRI